MTAYLVTYRITRVVRVEADNAERARMRVEAGFKASTVTEEAQVMDVREEGA